MSERSYAWSAFKNKKDNAPQCAFVSWDEMVKRLTFHREWKEKDGELWSPAEYPDGATRGKTNVTAVHAFVLDMDRGKTLDDPAPKPLEYSDRWAGLAYVIHTTYSHTAERPKWRAVFPLLAPIPAQFWPETWDALNHALGEGVGDTACSDCSRIYYLPSCPPGDDDSFALVGVGKLLDPREYPKKKVLVHHETGQPLDLAAKRTPERTRRDASLAARIVAGALDRVPSEGRHLACRWMMLQLYDNGFSRLECEQLGDLFRIQCPGVNSKGEPEEFGRDEMLALSRWAEQQPRREPWAQGREKEWTPPAGEPPATSEPWEEPAATPVPGEPETPPERTWRTYTFEQLAEMGLEEPEFPVESLLREGVNLFMGKTGDGKTWFSIDAAMAIASGGKSLGHRDVIKGDVLYLAFEESRGDMFQRLLQIREEAQSFPGLEIASSADEDWPMTSIGATLRAVREWLELHPAARLVVFDPLLGYLSQLPASNAGNMVQQDYNIIKQLRTLARKFPGVAFLVHDHRSKVVVGGANGRDPIDSGVHSSGTIAAADNRLALVREEGNVFKLVVKGRMVPSQELRLHFDPGTGSWEVREDAQPMKKSEVGVAILHQLAMWPDGLHYTEIAEKINASIGTVKGRLFRLAKSGHVSGLGGGRYGLGEGQ